MKGIKYLRKSREDLQRENETGEDVLQQHRERLDEVCRRHGISCTERAEVVSGDTISARPVFQRMLYEDWPTGIYECVVVTEISRLGRGDMEDAGKIYKALINYNIKIITPNKIYDPRNSADLRQIRFELFLSREEFESIRERLTAARDYRARQGFAGSYLPVLGIDTNRGKISVNEEEAALVREIFKMRASGKSYQDIANIMNGRNLKTKRGTRYHNTTIQKIIHNRRYLGDATWKGQVYEGLSPQVVSYELWKRVHEEVQPIKKVSKRFTPDKTPYIVELYCAHCGSRMYGEWITVKQMLRAGKKNNLVEYGVYNCIGRKKKPKCTHSKRVLDVNTLVLDKLKEIVMSPAVIRELEKERDRGKEGGEKELLAEISELKKQAAAKEKFLARCETDYEAGLLPAALYTKHYNHTVAEIERLKREVAITRKNLRALTSRETYPASEIVSHLNACIQSWEMLPSQMKKLIIASFLPKIQITRDGRLIYEATLPPQIDFSNGKRADY